jgi:hypothetical protein
MKEIEIWKNRLIFLVYYFGFVLFAKWFSDHICWR